MPVDYSDVKLDPYLRPEKYEELTYMQCVSKLAELNDTVYTDFVSRKESINTLFEIASLTKHMLLLAMYLEATK